MNLKNIKKYTKPVDQGDYYFSLKDFFSAFKKRKIIIILVFIIGYFYYGIGFFTAPKIFKLNQTIHLNSHSLMDQLSPYYDKQIRLDLISKALNINVVSTKIKQLVLDSDFNNEFTNKLEIIDRHELIATPIIFSLETNQPEVDLKKLTSFIELINSKISSDLKFDSIRIVNQILIPREEKLESLLYERKVTNLAKIALLEEANDIAIESNIVDPVISIIGKSPQLWTLGTDFLQAELNILKNRKNDEFFIYLDNRSIANIKRELNYYLNIDTLSIDVSKSPQFGKFPSPNNKEELDTTIKLLELELKMNIDRAKYHRFARIAMLEENIEFAKNFGIVRPILTKDLTSNGLFPSSSFNTDFNLDEYEIILGDFATELNKAGDILNSLDSDLSIYDKDYAYPLNNQNFNKHYLSSQKALLGSKYLTELITVLKKRENEGGDFSKPILDDNQYIWYLKSVLNRLESEVFLALKYETEPPVIKKIHTSFFDGLIRFSSILLILGIGLMLLVIFLKNDLRIKDKLH